MAAQKGRSFLLKRGSGSPLSYTTVAGLRDLTVSLNGEPVDVTNKDSSGWRELLAAAGTKSVSISASGVYTDDTSQHTLETDYLAQTIDSYEIVDEAGDYLSGTFLITTLDFAGSYNGEVTFSISLESSGEITRTRA